MVSRYVVLDGQGRVVNIVLWDGDISKWNPGPYTASLYDPAVAYTFLGPTPEQANQQTIVQQAQQALAANRTFVAAAKPGTAALQASAAYDQAVALSRQVNGALRLLLQQFDATN